MTKTLKEQIKEFSLQHLNEEFTTKAIKSELSNKYGTPMGSIIPTDYCYNLINNDPQVKKFKSETRFFEQLAPGVFKSLGPNYSYNGKVTHLGSIIGIWENGTFYKGSIKNNDQLSTLIKEYYKFKNESNQYDEQYKWDFAIKHQGIFNDLSNLPEKIASLGAPNFQSYFIQNSGIKWMVNNHPEDLYESFSVLFDEKKPLKERIASFRKKINITLVNDTGWENKQLADPGIDTASFFLFANNYLLNILFTKVSAFNNYAKFFKLDMMLNFTDYEQRYIDWQNYFLEILIPTMNNVLGNTNTLLDAQDFVWYVGNLSNILRSKLIEYFKSIKIEVDDTPKQYTALKLTKNIAEIHRVGKRSNKFRIIVNFDELDLEYQTNVKRVPDSYNWTNLNGEFWIDSEETYEEAKKIINNILEKQSLYINQNNEGEIMNTNINQPLNQILYGPPGTGKTYNTVIEAMKIFKNDPNLKINTPEEYGKLKCEFDKLKNASQIEFITFHQSYSYEEFVEGIRPLLNAKDVKYELRLKN